MHFGNLVYRTCENRVDENPAFLHYSLLYLRKLKKVTINRGKSEQRFAINFIQTSSVQDGVAMIVRCLVRVASRVKTLGRRDGMIRREGMIRIARETVLKVFKMCNMCLSFVIVHERKTKRGGGWRERDRERYREEVSKENT